MSFNHNHQQPRSRPVTKPRRERSASPIQVPTQEGDSEPHRAMRTSSKKQPSRQTSASENAPHGGPTRRDDLRSIGTWCEDIPTGQSTRRMSLDAEARAQHLPRAPTPPSPPYVPRLDSHDPSFLAYDTEFRIIQQDQEDDRVGSAWYIARQAKTNRQCKPSFTPRLNPPAIPQSPSPSGPLWDIPSLSTAALANG